MFVVCFFLLKMFQTLKNGLWFGVLYVLHSPQAPSHARSRQRGFPPCTCVRGWLYGVMGAHWKLVEHEKRSVYACDFCGDFSYSDACD